MGATVVIVTGTFNNADGTPGDGTIQFQLTKQIENSGLIYYPKPYSRILDKTGSFFLPLVANNDPDTEPGDSFYLVLERLTATSSAEYEIRVPFDAPGTPPTVRLADLLPENQGPG